MKVSLSGFDGLVREVLAANLDRRGHDVLGDESESWPLGRSLLDRPDAIVLGRLPAPADERCLRALRVAHPGVRIILVIADHDASLQSPDLVDAVLPQEARFDELDRALHGDRSHRPRRRGTPTTPWTPDCFLSPRERQVVRLLVDGLSSVEIAETLGLSTSTVHSHVQGLLRKLGARDRIDAVSRYLRATGPMDLGAVS